MVTADSRIDTIIHYGKRHNIHIFFNVFAVWLAFGYIRNFSLLWKFLLFHCYLWLMYIVCKYVLHKVLAPPIKIILRCFAIFFKLWKCILHWASQANLVLSILNIILNNLWVCACVWFVDSCNCKCVNRKQKTFRIIIVESLIKKLSVQWPMKRFLPS
jgi:hypothetical protein